MAKSVTRLGQQFQPKHYILDLSPSVEDMIFTGSVVISGQKTSRPSQRITLHQKDLSITTATITKRDKKGDQEIVVDRINTHNSFDEVRLHTAKMLYPGTYTITLEFEGKITKPMNGLYPCFFEQDGLEKILLATQFESHHAREVFPCIDEPEAKATFDLTLRTLEGQEVIANTPVSKQDVSEGLLVTTFETTPIMSTYLLAFVIGELSHIDANTSNGTLVRVFTTPDNIKHGEFALEIAIKCLEFYNEYFEIPYPLEKCDFVALPDFASGAMENWGLITFREQSLLFDSANTSLDMKQYIVMVIAHELTHQWFGNLVTMRWWTDLWLNEGFATWMSYLATDKLYPEWEMWTSFVVDDQQQALRLDALKNTHPVEVAINHPDEIRSIFDAISYDKGASVIQMLHDHLGAGPFRDGMRQYLKKHAYGSTDTVDLWEALEIATNKPVVGFMHAWTSLPGFPIVKATFNDTQLHVTQQRFFINSNRKHADDIVWPIVLQPGKDMDIFNSQETSYDVAKDVIKLNLHQSGFYRVVYDAEHLQKLGALIQNKTLSSVDRLGILSDTFEAAKAGHTNTVDALKLINFYQGEEHSAVWDVIAGSIGSLRATIDSDKLREDIKPYVRRLTAKQLKRLGWAEHKDESSFDTLLRPTILGMASLAEEPTVVAKALEMFKNMKKPEDLAPNIRSVVYGTAVRCGGSAEFNKLHALYMETTHAEEKVTLTGALTGFKQPDLIHKALDCIKDNNQVRPQDIAYWVAYSFMNRYAKNLTWEWMKHNWQWLDKAIGTDLSFYRMPIYAARSFSDKAFITEYQEFFEPRRAPAFDRSINQGLEMLESQSAWKQQAEAEVTEYFKNLTAE